MRTRQITAIFLMLVLCSSSVVSQSTAFNFQGRLNDGTSPANGRYDLRFRLFDAATGGGQVSQAVERLNAQLIEGVFSTTLDYGPNAFVEGESRHLEISLKPASSPNAYTVLGGRQPLMSVPYSIKSIYSAFAGLATSASNATNATNADTAQNANNLGGFASNTYARLNTTNLANFSATGNLHIGGNTTQNFNSNGLIKAMVYVNGGDGGILGCYNGVTGAATGNCGFTSIEAPGLTGVYKIDFGFNITNRFPVITAEYGAAQNKGANFRFFNTTTLDVFTFFSGNSSDTARTSFIIVLY